MLIVRDQSFRASSEASDYWDVTRSYWLHYCLAMVTQVNPKIRKFQLAYGSDGSCDSIVNSDCRTSVQPAGDRHCGLPGLPFLLKASPLSYRCVWESR